jgi:peptidyl-prolyl cis-trans isomerase C
VSRNASAVALLTAAIALACSHKDKDKKGPAVAKGGDVVVTAEEFKAKLDEQSPFIRSRYNTLERKKEFLENLIRFELLASEAKARKLDQDPEVQAALKKIMVQKLVRESFDEKTGGQASDGDAKKYYEEHQEEFVKPERVRVSQIFFKAAKGSPERSRKSADAKKVYAKLKSEEAKNPLAFSNAARDASDDFGSKAAGGDLGYRTRDEIEKQWGSEVASAAFGLKDVGQETSIVESAQGFHIVKLAARQPGLNRSFDEVKPQIVARIGREKRTKDFDAYVKKLREKADVKIYDAELEKIAVTAAAPSATPTLSATAATP